DERRKALDLGIPENDASELLLALCHRRVGDRLGRLGNRLNDAGILERKEALGDDDVEQGGKAESRKRYQEYQGLAIQHPIEHMRVDRDGPVESCAAKALKRI